MSSRLASLSMEIELSIYRMHHEMSFRDTLRELVLYPIRNLLPSVLPSKLVLPTLLQNVLGKDLSRFRMVDVGWYESKWEKEGEFHWIQDVREVQELSLHAQSLSICR